MRVAVISRRKFVKASTLLGVGAVCAERVKAAMPEPSAVTPTLIEAARKEGKVAFYSGALDLTQAEKISRDFEAKYPGIGVRVERSGSERIYQRIGQEHASHIYAADVVQSTDGAHFLDWKRDGLLAAYVPEEVAHHFPVEHIDPDGMFATVVSTLGAIGYNTKLVKPGDAPKSFADLLDPKWRGKIVKAHPSFSGIVLVSTFVIARDVGWPYFEKLAQQRVMLVQSAGDTGKKLVLGERAVALDAAEWQLLGLKEGGQPINIVYPEEGTPLITVSSGVLRNAPNPNAARLFQSYLFSVEGQRMVVDAFAYRSMHALVKDKAGRPPLSAIKLMTSNPAEVVKPSAEIKARFSRLFGV
jgi:iron(III) transport system substrate-binding protein